MEQIPKQSERTISLDFEIEPGINDKEDEEKALRMSFSFSSTFPVRRNWGNEILSHESNAIDFSRLTAGAPFLWNHNKDIVLGVLERAWVEEGKGRCEIKWSKRKEVLSYRQDVADGILKNVSTVYEIVKAKKGDNPEDIIVERWLPYEVSLVSVPADFTVGISRGIEMQLTPIPYEERVERRAKKCVKGISCGNSCIAANKTCIKTVANLAAKAKQEKVKAKMKEAVKKGGKEGKKQIAKLAAQSEKELAAIKNMGKGKKRIYEEDSMQDMMEIREQAIAEERERIEGIQALQKRFGNTQLAQNLIKNGASLERANIAYLDQLGKQEPAYLGIPPLDLSDKEQKEYRLGRAVLACAEGNWKGAGFEWECHTELQKRLGGKEVSGNGFFVPVRDLKVQSRAPYAVGASATGGYTVQTDLLAQDFIELLRNRIMCVSMGARMLSGLVGNVAIPSQATASTAYWVAEAGVVTESEGTFGQVTLSPKTVGTYSLLSRLMLLQPSLDIEMLIREDFASVIAREIDRVIINGSGSANQPRGILNTSGIGSVALGANGAAPTWDSMVSLESLVAIANADIGSLGTLTSIQARGKLKRTLKFSAAGSETVWQDNTAMSNGWGIINGYRAGATNQVPSNLVKGTSGAVCSAFIFGNWLDVLIGEWGVLEMLVNPYGAGYTSGGLEVRALQTIDIAIRRAASFAAIVDALTT